MAHDIICRLWALVNSSQAKGKAQTQLGEEAAFVRVASPMESWQSTRFAETSGLVTRFEGLHEKGVGARARYPWAAHETLETSSQSDSAGASQTPCT